MPEVLTRVDPDDSVEKLSGRGLDGEVALKVMGYYWGPITSAAFKKEFPLLFDQQFELHTPLGSYWYLPKTADWVRWKEIPRYSTSIEAAMAVVEKLSDRNFTVDMRTVASVQRWLVEFYVPEFYFGEAFVAESDSLAVAICRAALKAVRAE